MQMMFAISVSLCTGLPGISSEVHFTSIRLAMAALECTKMPRIKNPDCAGRLGTFLNAPWFASCTKDMVISLGVAVQDLQSARTPAPASANHTKAARTAVFANPWHEFNPTLYENRRW